MQGIFETAACTAVGAALLAAPAAPAQEQPAQERVVVTLIEPGEGERRVLRYTPEVGASHEYVHRFDMDIERDIGGSVLRMPIPTSTLTCRSSVLEVDDQGVYNLRVEVVGGGIEDTPGISEIMREGRKLQMESLVGATGVMPVTDRGLAQRLSIFGPGAQSDLIRRAGACTDRIIIPLPEEAVAPGASWRAEQVADAGMYTFDLVVTYRLVKIDGDDLHIEFDLQESAGHQEAAAGDGQFSFALESLSGEGDGQAVVRLTRFTPVSMRVGLDAHSMSSMTHQSGRRQLVDMKLDLDAWIHPPGQPPERTTQTEGEGDAGEDDGDAAAESSGEDAADPQTGDPQP